MTRVLKLGGSVVTRKDEPETVDDAQLGALAEAIAGHHDDLVVVHGGGSFGHYHASEHGVSTTAGSHDAAAARAIHGAMKQLNDAVVAALADRGVPAVPVHPFSAALRATSGDLAFAADPIDTMLGEGFVPVLHGDVVAHARKGVTVLSGDEIVADLATQLGADRVGLCSAVPGVLDADGDVVGRVEAFDDVVDALGGSDATDVTGGMAGKVRELLALSVPAYVFGVDDAREFLAGGEPGTRIG